MNAVGINQRFSIVLFSLSVVTGCGATGKIVVPADFNIPSPPDSRIPLKAALKLTPEFAGLAYRPVYCASIVFAGDALRAGSENVCRNIFRQVVVIEPASSQSHHADVIIVPTCRGIEHLFVGRATLLIRSSFLWQIMTPDGKEIYASTITGEAMRNCSTTFMASTTERELGEVCALSLQDHFRKVQDELRSSTWWKDPWWKQK